MDETVNTYLLADPAVCIPMGRKEFYAEQVAEFERTGAPTRAVEVINVLLFNSHGELFVQKRAFSKAHNPGLLDKSIGGHIKHGDTPDYTVMVETVQELQTPSIVLASHADFLKTLVLLREYLDTLAIIRRAHTSLVTSLKTIGGKQVAIANLTHTYIGVYNGKVRPIDREAKGILYYTLPEIMSEMESQPETFTKDLRDMLLDKRTEIDEMLRII